MVLIGSIGGEMRFVSYLLDGNAALGLGPGPVDEDGVTVRPVRLRDSERPVTVSAGPRTPHSTRPGRRAVRPGTRFGLPGHGRSPLAGGDPGSIGDSATRRSNLSASPRPYWSAPRWVVPIAATRPARVSRPTVPDALKTHAEREEAIRTRAATRRERGTVAVAETGAATSERAQRDIPVTATFCGEPLFRQPAGHAAACEALAGRSRAADRPASGPVVAVPCPAIRRPGKG